MATIFKRKGTGPYIIMWFDHSGRRREKSSRTTDKRVAERIAAKLEADVALRREGVVDPKLAAANEQAQGPVELHLAGFKAKMIAENRDPKHVESTISIIQTISDARGFRKLADIHADEVNSYAQTLKGQGRSARTIHAHLMAMKSFTRWLKQGRKLANDPLELIKKPNPKTDRRLERRILIPDEFRWLRRITEDEPARFGMISHERVLLYTTAIQTGLRSNELRSIRDGNCFIQRNNPKPFIRCKAGSTKNSKDCHQYIQPSLAAELREHVAQKRPEAPVFGMPNKDDVAEYVEGGHWGRTGCMDR